MAEETKEVFGLVPTLIGGYVDLPWMAVVVDAIDHNDRLLLVGHCGTGKTSAIEQIAARENREVRRVNLNGQTTVSDLVGQWIAKGGETLWVDGIIPDSMRKGQWLMLDEIDFAPPEILAAIHGPLEDNGYIVLAENGGEVVRPERGWRIFGTANTIGADVEDRGLYQGTSVMNEAFLDRWSAVVKVPWPDAQDEAKILTQRVPGLPLSTAVLIVRIAGELRGAFEKREIFTTFSTRKALQLADKAVRYGSTMEAARICIFNKLGDEDRKIVSEVFQRWTGERI